MQQWMLEEQYERFRVTALEFGTDPSMEAFQRVLKLFETPPSQPSRPIKR